jgi:glutamine synthetase
MNHREQEARYDIALETYTKKIQIESRIMEDISLNQILPAAVKYQKVMVDNLTGLKNVLNASEFKTAANAQLEMVKEMSERINIIKESVDKMVEERKKANNLDSPKKQALAYCDKVKPYFETVRYQVDKLERLIDNEVWPLPKYRELLYIK